MNRVLSAIAIIAAIVYITYSNGGQQKKGQNSMTSETVECLRSHIGTPHASKSANGLDCSALVQKCYGALNIHLPRDSRSQFKIGQKVTLENSAAGDLIFFLGSDLNSKKVGHSGIITNVTDNEILFIHSTLSKGVIESKLSETYYKKRFKGIRNVLNE